MKYVKEVTEWNAGYAVPNHTYYVNDAGKQAVGYIREGTDLLIKFSKPFTLDTRGRKFIALKRPAEKDSVYFSKESSTESKPSGRVITVEGSRGNKYSVTVLGSRITCSCPGFQFRGACKHAVEVAATAV